MNIRTPRDNLRDLRRAVQQLIVFVQTLERNQLATSGVASSAYSEATSGFVATNDGNYVVCQDASKIKLGIEREDAVLLQSGDFLLAEDGYRVALGIWVEGYDSVAERDAAEGQEQGDMGIPPGRYNRSQQVAGIA